MEIPTKQELLNTARRANEIRLDNNIQKEAKVDAEANALFLLFMNKFKSHLGDPDTVMTPFKVIFEENITTRIARAVESKFIKAGFCPQKRSCDCYAMCHCTDFTIPTSAWM